MKKLLLLLVLCVPFATQAAEKSPSDMTPPELCSTIASKVMASGELPIKSEHLTLYKVTCENETQLVYHGTMTDIPPVANWQDVLTKMIDYRACHTLQFATLVEHGVDIVNVYEFNNKELLRIVTTNEVCHKMWDQELKQQP